MSPQRSDVADLGWILIIFLSFQMVLMIREVLEPVLNYKLFGTISIEL